jgi:hypothetical protein
MVMKTEKPDDGLTARKAGGHAEAQPEVYAISRGRSGWSLSRRSVFSAAVAAATAVPKRSQAAACAAGAFADKGPRCLAISPDGRLLVSGGDLNSGSIKLWSLPDGALLKTITGQTSVDLVAISPDGRLLVSGLWGLDATLWTLPDGTLLKTFSSGLSPVAISPDGRLLAAGTSNSTLKLSSLPDGTLLKTMGNTGGADSLAISPDGRLLASGNRDNSVRLWSLPDGTLLKTFSGSSALALVISPDGRLLVSAGPDIKLWSLPDGQQLPVCLMDPTASWTTVSGTTYTKEGVTYTIPGGQPIPSGAVCTCNTVAGSISGGGGGGGHYWYPN